MKHSVYWAMLIMAIGCQSPESDDNRVSPDVEPGSSTEDDPLPGPSTVATATDEVGVDVEPKAYDALVVHSGPLNTFELEPNVQYGSGDLVEFPVVTLVNPTDGVITVSTLPLTTWVAIGDDRFEQNGFAPYIESCVLVDAYGGNEVSRSLEANEDFKMTFVIETPLMLPSAYVDAGVPMITSSQLRARCQLRQDLGIEQRVRLAFEVPMGDPDFQTTAASVSVANHNDLPLAARYVELAHRSSGCDPIWYDNGEVAPGQYQVTSRPLLTTNPRNSHTNYLQDGGFQFDVHVNGCGQGIRVKAVRVELQCSTCHLNTSYRMVGSVWTLNWVRPNVGTFSDTEHGSSSDVWAITFNDVDEFIAPNTKISFHVNWDADTDHFSDRDAGYFDPDNPDYEDPVDYFTEIHLHGQRESPTAVIMILFDDVEMGNGTYSWGPSWHSAQNNGDIVATLVGSD